MKFLAWVVLVVYALNFICGFIDMLANKKVSERITSLFAVAIAIGSMIITYDYLRFIR